jgi:hypothetical protein
MQMRARAQHAGQVPAGTGIAHAQLACVSAAQIAHRRRTPASTVCRARAAALIDGGREGLLDHRRARIRLAAEAE